MTTLEIDGWKAYVGAEPDNSEWPTAEIRPAVVKEETQRIVHNRAIPQKSDDPAMDMLKLALLLAVPTLGLSLIIWLVGVSIVLLTGPLDIPQAKSPMALNRQ